MRCFIAVDIPEEIKKEIIKIQNMLPAFYGKKTEKENLHLTLKFLGEVDESTLIKIREKLGEIRLNQFQIEISSLGMFADRIIWLDMKNCEKLQKEIDERLSDFFKPEERFMGHLTIARIRNLKDKRKFFGELKKIKFAPKKFTVECFKLKKSTLTEQKPIYEDIKVYDLKI